MQQCCGRVVSWFALVAVVMFLLWLGLVWLLVTGREV